MALANYFNRRAIAGFVTKGYAELLYRGRQFVESAEANEAQGIIFERLARIGDAALGPISLRSGGTIVVDAVAGSVRLGSAEIYAGGYMHTVPEATLAAVPMVGTVAIGIAVASIDVTDVEDAQLKGIVPNVESHGEPLAGRRRFVATWALAGDPFYPVYTLIDGQLPREVALPQDQAAELAVERHIRQTHGAHLVEGFGVSAGGFNPATQEQTFIIGAGSLRAEGREVRRSVDQRYRRVENPQLVTVNGETHLYPAGGVVTLNNGPIESVQTVTVIKEAVRTLTHQLAGGADALPDTPAYSIVAINAGGAWNAGTRTFTGGTNYAETTSWVKQGDAISWAPAGAEPSPGSTYTVVYRYIATVAPQAVGRQTINLEAAVLGQPVTVQYRWKLPRLDVIAIDLAGTVVYLEGLSTRYNPLPPPIPAPLAPLARVENRWGIDPIISDVDQRKLTEADGRAILRTLLAMQDRLSLVELEKDIQERDPASRKGSFVDPFVNDLQRDTGIAQDAAIVDGILQLPIVVTPARVDIGRDPIMLPFVTEPVLSQPFRTLSRKINRYLAFAPLPTPVALQPAVDRWNENQSSSSSSATSAFVRAIAVRPDLMGTPLYGTTSISTQVSSSTTASSSTSDLPFLRSIQVAYECRLMGPGEQLQSITFDGVDVTAASTGSKVANAQGVMSGTFTIPPNIRAGTKAVVITGRGGSRGETSFTGQGTITHVHYHTSTHTLTTATTIDPVAQSFVLGEGRQITGARVEFTARGNPANPVVIEMRDDANGLPAIETLAEGMISGAAFSIGDPAVVKPGNWTEMSFRFPTFVPASDHRWIALLTNDADHSVAVAQLGDQSDPNAPRGYDARRQEWIRRNPFDGDFADGSNGVSWLIQPDTDLTCEIMAARYTALTRTVPLGTFNLGAVVAGGVSDILVLLVVEQPSQDTKVRIEMVRASGEVVAFEPNAVLSLDEYLTETVTLRMVLTGTALLSPVVMPECQILWGRLKGSATYVSEAIAISLTNGPAKVRTVIEAVTPGTSAVAVAVGGTGAWTDQTGPLATQLGDGWIEREYLQSPVNVPEVRERITLTGTPKDRPRVRKLRVRATEV